jgi:hypothetical protein
MSPVSSAAFQVAEPAAVARQKRRTGIDANPVGIETTLRAPGSGGRW